MKLLKTFESRMSDVFGEAPQGFTAPFSLKKLAKRTVREMEGETFVVDGVDTAPALFTLLVSPTDDTALRPLYSKLTKEIVSFVEAQAKARSYVFVGRPLARFMVDPSLRSGRFAVFAENVDARTLTRLRDEEEAFLSSSLGLGGAAAAPRDGEGASDYLRSHARSERRPRTMPAVAEPKDDQEPLEPAVSLDDDPYVAPAPQDGLVDLGIDADVSKTPMERGEASDASAGLAVLPNDVVQDALQDPYDDASGEGEPEERAPEPDDLPGAPVRPARPSHLAPPADSRPVAVPATQRRNVPLVNQQRQSPVAGRAADGPSCMLVDHQTGRTYRGVAPETIVGRERTPGGIVIHDPNVSRRHAELSYDGHSWHIRDLGSTNGTLVNDVDVDVCTLRDGDLITLGLTNLVFQEEAR